MSATKPDWSDGYVVDVAYVHNFHPGLTPVNLAFAALQAGVRPPDIDAPFAYLDLGCGNGFTPALIAAACPQADVWANDFNPVHIRNAKAIADAAGLTNTHFIEANFSDLLDTTSLPQFDIVVAHGIWSWVSAANRARIVALLTTRLKPGGLLLVSYNCHPGWDSLLPLRRLLATAGGSEGGAAERIDRALGIARRLCDGGADYFRNTPAARETLDVLLRADRAYIAHEFLNECWSLFHPGEVAAELAPAGLRYVGPGRTIDGLDRFWLSDDQRALLAEAPDTAARESLRDVILDRRFRHDLFVREGGQTEPVTTEPVTAASWFAERRYALANSRADCALALTVRGRETLLPTTPFTALLDALAVRPETGVALAGLPGIAGIAPSEIFEALGILIATGHVQPALPERDQIARRQSTDRFNAAALEAARMGNPLAALASPVTGSGIGVPGSEQLLIDALQSGIRMDMLSITDADGVDIAVRFRDHSMPRLEMLGIL